MNSAPRESHLCRHPGVSRGPGLDSRESGNYIWIPACAEMTKGIVGTKSKHLKLTHYPHLNWIDVEK
jgi:hypothetical protein